MNLSRELYEKKALPKVKTLILHAIINEAFITAIPFDDGELTPSLESSMSKYSYNVLESLGGYNLLTEAIANCKNVRQQNYLKKIDNVCNTIANKAVTRLATEAITSGQSITFASDPTLNDEEYEEFEKLKFDLSVKQVGDIIRTKIVDTIEEEKKLIDISEDIKDEVDEKLTEISDARKDKEKEKEDEAAEKEAERNGQSDPESEDSIDGNIDEDDDEVSDEPIDDDEELPDEEEISDESEEDLEEDDDDEEDELSQESVIKKIVYGTSHPEKINTFYTTLLSQVFEATMNGRIPNRISPEDMETLMIGNDRILKHSDYRSDPFKAADQKITVESLVLKYDANEYLDIKGDQTVESTTSSKLKVSDVEPNAIENSVILYGLYETFNTFNMYNLTVANIKTFCSNTVKTLEATATFFDNGNTKFDKYIANISNMISRVNNVNDYMVVENHIKSSLKILDMNKRLYIADNTVPMATRFEDDDFDTKINLIKAQESTLHGVANKLGIRLAKNDDVVVVNKVGVSMKYARESSENIAALNGIADIIKNKSSIAKTKFKFNPEAGIIAVECLNELGKPSYNTTTKFNFNDRDYTDAFVYAFEASTLANINKEFMMSDDLARGTYKNVKDVSTQFKKKEPVTEGLFNKHKVNTGNPKKDNIEILNNIGDSIKDNDNIKHISIYLDKKKDVVLFDYFGTTDKKLKTVKMNMYLDGNTNRMKTFEDAFYSSKFANINKVITVKLLGSGLDPKRLGKNVKSFDKNGADSKYSNFIKAVLSQSKDNQFAKYSGDISFIPKELHDFYRNSNPVNVDGVAEKNVDDEAYTFYPAEKLMEIQKKVQADKKYQCDNSYFIFANLSPFYPVALKNGAVYIWVKNNWNKVANTFDQFLKRFSNTSTAVE